MLWIRAKNSWLKLSSIFSESKVLKLKEGWGK